MSSYNSAWYREGQYTHTHIHMGTYPHTPGHTQTQTHTREHTHTAEHTHNYQDTQTAGYTHTHINAQNKLINIHLVVVMERGVKNGT